MKVNIYLETDKQCQACIQRKYGYVIEIMYHGQIVIQGRIWMCGKHISSVQPAGACGSTVKISFFQRDLCTHERYLCGIQSSENTDLAAGGFKDTKGNDIKNADEWRMVYGPINQLKLVVSSSVGTHSYSQWLQEEMIKRGN